MAFELDLTEVGERPSLRRLDRHAKQALANAALHDNPARALAIELPEPDLEKSEARADRIQRELTKAVGAWQQYAGLIDDIPDSPQTLRRNHTDFDGLITRLYDTKDAVATWNLRARSGVPMEDELEPVIIPWRSFYENWGTYFSSLRKLRAKQGTMQSADAYAECYYDMINDGTTFYRDPDQPGRLVTPLQYLSDKLATDGPWGVMLMQTGVYPHCKDWPAVTADDITAKGRENFRVSDIPVDRMGIFEWTALTLQVDPRRSALASPAMLLGNRFTIDGRDFVPRTCHREGHLIVNKMTADMNFSARPRWTIS